LARLLILRNRQDDQPNWDEVHGLLARAEKDRPSIEIIILQAEAEAEQGHFDKARERLEKVEDQNGPPAEVRVALSALEERQRRPAAALALLDEAQRRLGDRVELRLARIRYWGAHKGDEARKELARLGEDLFASPQRKQGNEEGKFSDEEQQV